MRIWVTEITSAEELASFLREANFDAVAEGGSVLVRSPSSRAREAAAVFAGVWSRNTGTAITIE